MTEWRYAVVDTSNDITTITAVPCLVRGAYINTVLSAHTVNLEDGTTAAIVLPASAGAGNFYPPQEIETRFETSLIVDPDNSSTGNITVFYKSLR